MAQEKTLTIAPAAWSPAAARLIALALSDATVDDIKFQTEHGNAKLFSVTDQAGEMVLAFVLRVDHMQHQSQGVIVAAGGQAECIDLTATVLPTIEAMFDGCESVRIHTERPGLVKKLARQGYGVSEIVLTKKLRGRHGQK